MDMDKDKRTVVAVLVTAFVAGLGLGSWEGWTA